MSTLRNAIKYYSKRAFSECQFHNSFFVLSNAERNRSSVTSSSAIRRGRKRKIFDSGGISQCQSLNNSSFALLNGERSRSSVTSPRPSDERGRSLIRAELLKLDCEMEIDGMNLRLHLNGTE
ncbi:hypothetical protein CEXT_794231 [Caerostris extrusa]|uniref:Uncharacterized protein n=1 Tax=Caerostris extrusa TaxID=172846 RepID=A0AAV4SN41_CAEEX|nr:hypothetical protein CEXT_794231 [Caerostris extrusa]